MPFSTLPTWSIIYLLLHLASKFPIIISTIIITFFVYPPKCLGVWHLSTNTPNTSKLIPHSLKGVFISYSTLRRVIGSIFQWRHLLWVDLLFLHFGVLSTYTHLFTYIYTFPCTHTISLAPSGSSLGIGSITFLCLLFHDLRVVLPHTLPLHFYYMFLLLLQLQSLPLCLITPWLCLQNPKPSTLSSNNLHLPLAL